MIYTSYYVKLRSLNTDDFILIQISNSAPDIKGLKKLDYLIPDWDNIVKPYKEGKFNQEIYNFKYWSQLNNLPGGIKWVAKCLETLQDKADKDILLLCYESPLNFCHRHFIAEWCNPYLDKYHQIKEYEIPKIKEPEDNGPETIGQSYFNLGSK